MLGHNLTPVRIPACLALWCRRRFSTSLTDSKSTEGTAHTDPRHGRLFGTGLSRTGTRSLHVALRRLGLSSVHYPYDALTERELFEGEPSLSILERHQAMVDLPAAGFFRELDRRYPDSRFIHTVRDRNQWLEAVERHYRSLVDNWSSLSRRFREFSERITQHVYGAFPFDRAVFAEAYDRHEGSVASHFVGRPADLLVLDVADASASAELAAFLGRQPASNGDFPHVTDADEVPDSALRRTHLKAELGE
jgi:hypothetical protein